jgi:hypothetical protein
MRKLIIFFGLIFSLGFVFNHAAAKDDWPVLKGPYLGQKPPGMKPEMFAPGIISTELHDDAAPVFTKNGREVYFRIVYKKKGKYFGTYFHMKENNGVWSPPQIAHFTRHMDGKMVLSPDNQALLFSSAEITTNSHWPMDIWGSFRADGKWSKSKKMDKINTKDIDRLLFMTNENDLFWELRSMTTGKVIHYYKARYNGGDFTRPQIVSLVNLSYETFFQPVLSPNGKVLIITKRTAQRGFDLFVLFKKKDGKWSNPFNLGDKVNSKYMDKAPGFSPDGKYLFFVSSRLHEHKNPQKKWSSGLFENQETIFRADIYWVDAKIIEDLKPKEFK